MFEAPATRLSTYAARAHRHRDDEDDEDDEGGQSLRLARASCYTGMRLNRLRKPSAGPRVGRVNLRGAHGVALAPDFGVGFTSNGGENKVSVFDLKTLRVLTKIDTGGNPDSIVYHPATHNVFVQNGKGNSSSVIDAEKRQVVATIPLGGKPEFAVYDDNGNLFVNIEDKEAIVVIDTANKKVKATWPVAGCEEPSGLAIDRSSHTLFSACSNKLMAIVDSENGKLI